MGVRVVDIEPMSQEDIIEWRKNVPEGHTRHSFTFEDPDEKTRAKSGAERVGDEAHVRVDPLPAGHAEPRDLIENYTAKLLTWAKADRATFQSRAKLLKQTSPLQFSHLTEDQLTDQLIEMVTAKAREAVQRVYLKNKWVGAANLELTSTPRGPLYLPGQSGRT